MGARAGARGDGAEAWALFEYDPGIRLALIDWMMPELDGLSLCRRVRERASSGDVYLILVTAKGRKEDVVAGLEAGADDFVAKPFDAAELRARIRAGERILVLRDELGARLRDLEEALACVKRLEGVLPICMYCQKIRDDRRAWQPLETYISECSDAKFSHGICDACLRERFPNEGPEGGAT